MTQRFFEEPILNSPYEYPDRHWVLDGGQPTDAIVNTRRASSFVTPIPKSNPRRGRAKAKQTSFGFDRVDDLSDDGQQYAVSQRINEMRREIERWRRLPQEKWGVTPPTARLLAQLAQLGTTCPRPATTRKAPEIRAARSGRNLFWHYWHAARGAGADSGTRCSGRHHLAPRYPLHCPSKRQPVG